MDITSMTLVSLGGNKHWLVVVDDASGKVFSQFMKNKSALKDVMIRFFRRMKDHGTPVKCVRYNNAGENTALQELCKKDLDHVERLCTT